MICHRCCITIDAYVFVFWFIHIIAGINQIPLFHFILMEEQHLLVVPMAQSQYCNPVMILERDFNRYE